MPQFESLINESEFVSDHYLTSDETKQTFLAQVRTRRRQWNADRTADIESPLARFTAGRIQLLTQLSALSAGTSAEQLVSQNKIQETYQHLLEVFGYRGPLSTLTTQRGNDELVLDSVWFQTRPGTEDPAVVVVPASPAASLDDALSTSKPLCPAVLAEKPQVEWNISKTVSELFQTEEPPSYVVIVAGRFVVLAERARWAEGRYLAMDIQLVAERHETKQGGEIDYLLTIFSSESLTPAADGTFWWDEILDESVSHAVSVSEDLREGVRRSIEIIANDVLDRHREQGLSLADVDGNVLARQAMRYLYRILFLLYAEASPELGVLPVGVEEYDTGYGLDRLRELIADDLAGVQAEQGTHFYDSLALLFDLVNGSHPIHEHLNGNSTNVFDGADSDNTHDDAEFRSGFGEDGLVFQPLRADLFEPDATGLIDRVKLSNRALHEVLTRLLLSSERSGVQRGYVSYATLGVNQLGAVYEGLMSYTGFIADEPLHEVAPGGDAAKGSWVVPVTRSQDLAPSDFVTVTDPDTGETRPVVHPAGSFVYRLAGRERQQTASYYTPEVLTRFVVSQALEELLDQPDQDGTPQRTSAADILELSVCEPALGSGAFAIEAVRQLAEAYLSRREEELDHRIPAEDRAAELQKVKAHIALHQVYGVDLNDAAVELAEISLWLDTMSTDLQAPWFGLRLQQGNSLLGAKRASYTLAQVRKKEYLKTAPVEHPLTSMAEAMAAEQADDSLLGRVHHFLLPAEGWGAAASVKEVKDLAGDNQRKLRDWQRTIRTQLSKDQQDAVHRLANRVETLWPMALRRLQIAEHEAHRDIEFFGKPSQHQTTSAPVVSREQIEQTLNNPDGIYQRLKLVMDLWSALWFWPVVPDDQEQQLPPDLGQWISTLQMILGIGQTMTQERKQAAGQGDLLASASWADLDAAEATEMATTNMRPITEILEKFPWVATAQQVAAEQNFFHWELTFGTVFANGGFDLQVGNPPWVRPTVDVEATLAEFDPWWQLAHKPTQQEKRAKRERTLALSEARKSFVHHTCINPVTSAWLRAVSQYPVLKGLQPDLYRAFMARTWEAAHQEGIVSLVHPISHFTEKRAGRLRKATYRRQRRHWHFTNALKLYEVHTNVNYGVHIYGEPKGNPEFLMAAALYHPDTVTRSLLHDGSGKIPGLRDDEHNLDTRPHQARIQQVDNSVLATWKSVLEEPSTPVVETRMLFLPNTVNAGVLEKMAQQPRIRDLGWQSSSGWHESSDRRKGYFDVGSAQPETWQKVILQGPHFNVATPLAKNPRPTMRSSTDYEDIDLEALPVDFIPRTNYQPVQASKYAEDYTHWEHNGKQTSARDFYRVVWRNMVNIENVRTLIPTVIPPGAAHVHTVVSAGPFQNLNDLLLYTGLLASLPYDFLFRATGGGHIALSDIANLPRFSIRDTSPLGIAIRQVAARLICLTEVYAPLWEENFDQQWSHESPARKDLDRRNLAVELDVLAAMALGLSVDDLTTLYRTQFPVLRNYERNDLYDVNGRKVPNHIAREYRKHGEDLPLAECQWVHPQSQVEYTFEFPFRTLDREQDYRDAWAKFERELG